jgi:hypothetical protein
VTWAKDLYQALELAVPEKSEETVRL